MRIIFNYRGERSVQSPYFSGPNEETMDYFWDEFLGGEHEDSELFWNSDVSGSDDEIIVDWFAEPTNHQKMVDELQKGLKVSIPPYTSWESK
jgi:hypothetical protein